MSGAEDGGPPIRHEVSAMEARQKLGELLDQVYHKDDQFVIKRADKPMAVVISMRVYEELLKQRNRDFAELGRLRQSVPEMPEEQVNADIEAAIAEVRAEKRSR